MYVIVESLRCIPETNSTYATHISIKNMIFKMEGQDNRKPTEMEKRVGNLEFGEFNFSKEFKEQAVLHFLVR